MEYPITAAGVAYNEIEPIRSGLMQNPPISVETSQHSSSVTVSIFGALSEILSQTTESLSFLISSTTTAIPPISQLHSTTSSNTPSANIRNANDQAPDVDADKSSDISLAQLSTKTSSNYATTEFRASDTVDIITPQPPTEQVEEFFTDTSTMSYDLNDTMLDNFVTSTMDYADHSIRHNNSNANITSAIFQLSDPLNRSVNSQVTPSVPSIQKSKPIHLNDIVYMTKLGLNSQSIDTSKSRINGAKYLTHFTNRNDTSLSGDYSFANGNISSSSLSLNLSITPSNESVSSGLPLINNSENSSSVDTTTSDGFSETTQLPIEAETVTFVNNLMLQATNSFEESVSIMQPHFTVATNRPEWSTMTDQMEVESTTIERTTRDIPNYERKNIETSTKPSEPTIDDSTTLESTTIEMTTDQLKLFKLTNVPSFFDDETATVESRTFSPTTVDSTTTEQMTIRTDVNRTPYPYSSSKFNAIEHSTVRKYTTPSMATIIQFLELKSRRVSPAPPDNENEGNILTLHPVYVQLSPTESMRLTEPTQANTDELSSTWQSSSEDPTYIPRFIERIPILTFRPKLTTATIAQALNRDSISAKLTTDTVEQHRATNSTTPISIITPIRLDSFTQPTQKMKPFDDIPESNTIPSSVPKETTEQLVLQTTAAILPEVPVTAKLNRSPEFDFVIYGILPNNTVVRKLPESTSTEDPHVVIGILANNTVVRKYPNGSIIAEPKRDSRSFEITNIDPKNLFNPNSDLYKNDYQQQQRANSEAFYNQISANSANTTSFDFAIASNGINSYLNNPTSFSNTSSNVNSTHKKITTVFNLPQLYL